MQSSSLKIQSRESRPGHFELALDGRLDSVAADRLEDVLDRLLESGAKRIALDMKELSFIASRGIGVVIGTYKRLRSDGGELIMSNMQGPVQKSVPDHRRLAARVDLRQRGRGGQLLRSDPAQGTRTRLEASAPP